MKPGPKEPNSKPDWKETFQSLLRDAEMTQRDYLRIREAYQDMEMKLGLALCNLQEHYERKPLQMDIAPFWQKRLRNLLDWVDYFNLNKKFP